jgi:hypothetical protein
MTSPVEPVTLGRVLVSDESPQEASPIIKTDERVKRLLIAPLLK